MLELRDVNEEAPSFNIWALMRELFYPASFERILALFLIFIDHLLGILGGF